LNIFNIKEGNVLQNDLFNSAEHLFSSQAPKKAEESSRIFPNEAGI